ncbi:MAG: apolipoprotein N-acyltransferase [Lacisediminihabitans sp.]
MQLSPRPPLSLWWSALVAAIGGALNACAFPALGWWPLIFVGTAVMLWAFRGRSVAGSLFIGFIAGFAFFGSHIFWLTVYLGPIPWLALAGLESIFFAIGAMLMSLAWRFLPLVWSGRASRITGVPLVLAGLWTLREAVSAVWPYGGFSWGRLAFSQSDSPFSSLVSWVGVSGLSFLLAWFSALVLVVVLETNFAWSMRAILATSALLLLVAVPAWPIVSSASMRVAAVQGNADAGLFAQHPPGTTLDDHLQATVPLFGKKADVVVWPENAADVDPLRNTQSAQTLDFVSEQMHAPLVTGTITQDSKGRTFNSLLLWEAGKGSVQQYDKIHPVPFAEYLPDRAFWYPLAPELLAMVPRDYSFGQRSNVFDINGIKAGVAICFDIVDDSLVHQMIDGGAQIILAPTNNADFGHSDESRQQIAIAKLRAIETGRSVVNISTVGMSAIFAPDGHTIAELPDYTAGAMLKNVPLSTTITPAMLFGRAIEWLVGGLGLAGLAVGCALRWAERARSRRG